MTDKENFVCLSCYFVGELDVHGRCAKCGAEAVASVEAIKALDNPTTKAVASYQASQPQRESKPLKWWHFVCGPFETYISNYRVTNLEEAKHAVTHDNFEWTVVGDVIKDFEMDWYGLAPETLSKAFQRSNCTIAVTELTAEEYEVQWRQGNARKSEYYQTQNIEAEISKPQDVDNTTT